MAYGYPVLFLGVLLENAGVPVPGEAAVLAAGFLASPAGGWWDALQPRPVYHTGVCGCRPLLGSSVQVMLTSRHLSVNFWVVTIFCSTFSTKHYQDSTTGEPTF